MSRWIDQPGCVVPFLWEIRETHVKGKMQIQMQMSNDFRRCEFFDLESTKTSPNRCPNAANMNHPIDYKAYNRLIYLCDHHMTEGEQTIELEQYSIPLREYGFDDMVCSWKFQQNGRWVGREN